MLWFFFLLDRKIRASLCLEELSEFFFLLVDIVLAIVIRGWVLIFFWDLLCLVWQSIQFIIKSWTDLRFLLLSGLVFVSYFRVAKCIQILFGNLTWILKKPCYFLFLSRVLFMSLDLTSQLILWLSIRRITMSLCSPCLVSTWLTIKSYWYVFSSGYDKLLLIYLANAYCS